MVKRGDGIDELKGPQMANLLNFSEKMKHELNARNVWAHCYNELNQGAPSILRTDRITWFTFVRFKRDYVLVHDVDDWTVRTLAGWQWERSQIRCAIVVAELAVIVAAGVAAARAKVAEQANAKIAKADKGPGDDGPPGGNAVAGPGKPKRPRRPGDDTGPSEFRLISAAPRRRRPARSLQSWRAAVLWRMRKIARRAPPFRHMRLLAEDLATLANAAARRFAGEAQNALRGSRRWLNHLFGEAEQIVQDAWFGALCEPQIVERGGTRLIVWTFRATIPWERWLFGRLSEEEQAAA
jgi:hypothetical protein